MKNYRDTTLAPEERAKLLLQELSLEEKLAQTQCVLVSDDLYDRAKEFCTYGIGSISTLEIRNCATLEDAAAFQRKFQKMAMERSPHHIPAIFHMEGVNGAFIQGAASFPAGINRGASFDMELEEKFGEIVSRQELSVGITQTLAPVLDISRDSRMGRQAETYGEDPTVAAALGSAYTRGLQGTQVEGLRTDGVAKHFMGFHNSLGGIHGAASYTPKRLMNEIYGKSFQAAITHGQLHGIMPCYCSYDGDVASVSRELLTDTLRDEMGFDGVVLSDYSAISNVHKVQGLYENMAETGYAAMSAGMDIEAPMPDGFGADLLEQFRSGQADVAVLDTAVLRILTAKFRMGLFERPFALTGEALHAAFQCPEAEEVLLRSTREGLVLLKNDGVLPLAPKGKKIAVIGPHAKNARSFFGGYTHISMVEATRTAKNSIAGIDAAVGGSTEEAILIPGTQVENDEQDKFDQVLRHIKPDCRNLLEELRARFPDAEFVYAYGYPVAGGDASHYEEALKVARDADLCILTLGGKYGSCSAATMGEGVDSTDINLPVCQESFIRRLAELGKPMVGVHLDGRPISSDAADQCLNAILEAFSPSEKGAQAIVDVLTGVYNPSGKLPVSVAYSAGQIPVHYNHPNGSSWHQGESIGFQNYVNCPHEPRYRFGFGLSYTTFAYDRLSLSTKELAPDGQVEVTLTVKNTGDRAGTEVVQLYVRDVYASMVRPSLELAGFRRVELAPGEEKQVCFTLSASQLAFLDRDFRWKVEKGEVEIMVGASSEDLRLRDSVRVTGDAFPDGKNRAFWA